MSILEIDFNGDHLSIDEQTGDVFDSSHNLIGHFDAHSHQIMDAHGNALMHFDPINHHIFDNANNALGSIQEIAGRETLLDPAGSVVSMHDSITDQIVDASLNVLANLKRLW